MKTLAAIIATVAITFSLANYADAQCPGGVYPYQFSTSQHWTYPGEIHDHLRDGHGFNAAGLTRAQAEAEHDRLHNAARQSGNVANRQQTYQFVPWQSQQRFRLFGRRR